MTKPFWMERSSSICVLSASSHLSHSFRTRPLLGVGQWIRSGSNAIRCFLHASYPWGFLQGRAGAVCWGQAVWGFFCHVSSGTWCHTERVRMAEGRGWGIKHCHVLNGKKRQLNRKLWFSDQRTVILLKQANCVYHIYGIIEALLMLSGIQIWWVNRWDTFQLSILSCWYLNCKDNQKR